MNNIVVSIRSEVLCDSRIKKAFIRLIMGKVDVVVCQSDRAKINLSEIMGGKHLRSVVIPNWVVLGSDTGKTYDYTASWFSDKRPLKLVFAGWLEKTKGIGELVTAVRSLLSMGFHIELHIFGDGGMRAELRGRIQADGLAERVFMHGWKSRSDLLCAYSNLDVFVLPSYTEGMPNSVLEAMARGLAILATDVGGVPELVSNGTNGILFGKKSSVAIEEAIEYLYGNPSLIAEMGIQSRRIAESRHDYKQAMREIESLLFE